MPTAPNVESSCNISSQITAHTHSFHFSGSPVALDVFSLSLFDHRSEVEFLEKQFTEAKNNKSPALLPASLEKTETTSAQVNVRAKVNVDSP
jgi:hypothetical protein